VLAHDDGGDGGDKLRDKGVGDEGIGDVSSKGTKLDIS